MRLNSIPLFRAYSKQPAQSHDALLFVGANKRLHSTCLASLGPRVNRGVRHCPMYSEGASFKFNDTVSQTRRFEFLSSMSKSCESAGISLGGNSPGFSIALKSNGKCDLVVWNPSKWNTACIQLRMGEREGILAVVSPHNFSAMADEIDALSKEKPNANKSFQRTVKKLRFLPSAEFKR